MENSRSVSILFFVHTVVLSIVSINCKDNNNLVTNQAALFVFGDSLFDAGNNNYIDTFSRFKSNIWPYGQTTFKSPTGRISDGRLIPDFIAEYAWLPLIPPNLQPSNGHNQFTFGVNFASGGAGALVETFPGMVISLGAQLNNFKNVEKRLRSELGDSEAKRIISRAVYLFHIGGNDYVYPILFANSSTFKSSSKEKFSDFVLGNITAVIERLESDLSGFKYALHDYHTSLSERINNRLKYGFKEGKKACCGTGPLRGINTCGGRVWGLSQRYELCENVTEYLFFDSFHLTEKAHRQIAELIWSGPSNVTGPYNLKALFELK
ncbi:unnamed protein product [Brassica rapa subsp. trilocularis]|uniref:Uncharacterized protein n=1 Tax=Brassica campestris TaxID=3711 RepID=M4FF29_BRACM